MLKQISEGEILNYFKDRNLDNASSNYLNIHLKRYKFLLFNVHNAILKFSNTKKFNKIRLLDIGPYFQTELMNYFFDNIIIDTLSKDSSFNKIKKGTHNKFDLNNLQFSSLWPNLGTYDIIVIAEVLEHLSVSPHLVFQFLNKILKKKGYIILQTPNAISLTRRISMVLGNYSKDLKKSHHFKEYSLNELINFGEKNGFKVNNFYLEDYFNNFSLFNIFSRLISFIHKSLRTGITIIYKKI